MRTLVAARDPAAVDAALVALVRDLCRRAGREATDIEVRAALAPLSAAEETALRRWSNGAPPARPLGPMAWADVARGTQPPVAAARELSGYYQLLVERDALASLVRARAPAGDERPPASPAVPPPDPPPPQAPPRPRGSGREARAQHILGLYAYYRDPPRVARELNLSMFELEAEVDDLNLRRKASKFVRGTDFDLPMAQPTVPGRSGPPLRRRAGQKPVERPPPPPPPPEPAPEPEPPPRQPPPPPPRAKPRTPDKPEDQAAQLKKMLAQVGARRKALAAKLGPRGEPLPERVLLARFRAAGLDREFGLRERDLVRGLYKRHHGSSAAVAADLDLPVKDLGAIVEQRGLSREVESLRESYRREARAAAWPRARIELLLQRRGWLTDLGILREIEEDVRTRGREAWQALRAAGHSQTKAVDLLSKELRIAGGEARALTKLLRLT